MRVIFLDIDGVLNYWSCPYKLRHQNFVDPKLLEYLKIIINKTDAKIVLSSTWRYGWFDLEEGINSNDAKDFLDLKNKFKEYNLEIYDKTPDISKSWYHGSRGREIDIWLHNWKGEEITSFIILDDLSFMEPHQSNLINIDPSTGLSKKDVTKAISMLLN